MNRLLVLQRCFVGCFAIVALNLARLQVVQGRAYRRLAEQNHLRLVPSSAPRGRILDRNGLVLAGNRPSFDVVIVPQEVDDIGATLTDLARVLGRSPESLGRVYAKGKTLPFAPVTVARDIPRETAMIIEERRHQLPGVFVQPQALRVYPEGAAAAHVVGYIGDIDAGELAALQEYGYRIRDRVGKTGIERRYDAYVRGEAGGTMVEVDHRGRFMRIRGVREAAPGKDIQLTVIGWLQRRATELLANRRGACVVLDAHTGEVLALVSSPAFNPNTFLDPDSAGRQAILTAQDSPMLERAAGAAFTPGSIFKIVTASAGLESRHVTPLVSVTCRGALTLGRDAMKCWKLDGHGPEDMRLALAHSCNVYFGQVGLWTGPALLHTWALEYGLGRATGIELPGEAAGAVPGPSWFERRRWYAGDTAHLAIGQGGLLLSPLQAAVMTAAIANGGWAVKPHLVRAIGGIVVAGQTARRLPLSPETLAVIRSGMEAAVALPDGTGHLAHAAHVRVAAKTGTAQTQIVGHPHGWFVGYAPAEEPQIVVVVLLEHGGSGGQWPTDIARQLIDAWAMMREQPQAPPEAAAAEHVA